ncbi:MAG: helix-hairpin-helix domain-containing protein [Parcubacteria group bacterium]
MSGPTFKIRFGLLLIFIFVFVLGKAASLEAALININTANVAELDTLPGIGPAYAQRIIDYRTTNAPFTAIEEIQNVSGIGPTTFANIKDLITVGSTVPSGGDIPDVSSTTSTQTSSNTSNTTTLYSSLPVTSFQSASNLTVGIGKDRVGVVGSPMEFKVESNIKLAQNSGLRWNFGDGTEAGGDVVTHVYEYPGEYVVVLNVDAREGQAVARVNVKIFEPDLEITYADKDRIEVRNNSEQEVNLFGRAIFSSSNSYGFPRDTILKPGQKINFSTKVTKLDPNSSQEVFIVVIGGYPNSLIMKEKIKEYKSKRIEEINMEVATLQNRLVSIRQANFYQNNSAQEVVVVEETEEVDALQEISQTASVIDSLSDPNQESRGWLSVIKRFFLGQDK